MLRDVPAPFVLLDDVAAGDVPARLYRDPVAIISAETLEGVTPALDQLRRAVGTGQHAAGFIGYDAALAVAVPGVPAATAALPTGSAPLLWFGIFEGYNEIASRAVAALLPDPAGAWLGAPEPEIDRADYIARLDRLLDLIVAGDLYQANLTYRMRLRFAGDVLALYARLRTRGGGGYGAIIDTGAVQLLSCSPELFFAVDGGAVTCRPMKGTARRGKTPSSDAALARALVDNPKQRAENLMIVDLMRNDLARIAVPGSVAVPALFAIESYPTLHQLVSTVTARLAPGRDPVDVLTALFPCGSITGAPKIRAIAAIAEVERDLTPRGPYTGAIGRIDPGGDAAFNVAIRTLVIGGAVADTDAVGGERGRGNARIADYGVGGGIVADSRADEEWDETLAKAEFLTGGQTRFDLFETMAFDPLQGVLRLDRHLARLSASAALFGFAVDRHEVRNELQAATFRLRSPHRIRLALAPGGAVALEVRPMPAAPSGRIKVAVVPLPVDPGDFRLRHKTSDRGFYDAARRGSGADEVVFAAPGGWLTEGSFSSLFVPRGVLLVTPPLARGLLPGVLRGALIDEGRAVEGDLRADDLAAGFYVGNALRGLLPAVVSVAGGAGRAL